MNLRTQPADPFHLPTVRAIRRHTAAVMVSNAMAAAAADVVDRMVPTYAAARRICRELGAVETPRGVARLAGDLEGTK